MIRHTCFLNKCARRQSDGAAVLGKRGAGLDWVGTPGGFGGKARECPKKRENSVRCVPETRVIKRILTNASRKLKHKKTQEQTKLKHKCCLNGEKQVCTSFLARVLPYYTSPY